VIAIENARLFEAERASKRELQQSLEYQTATSNVLEVISRSPTELQPVLNAIVETAARLCHADNAHVVGLKDGKYHLAAFKHTNDELIKYLSENPIEAGQKGSVAGRAALERRTPRCAVWADAHVRPGRTGHLSTCAWAHCSFSLNIGTARRERAPPYFVAGPRTGSANASSVWTMSLL
jgi:hypothetical protein